MANREMNTSIANRSDTAANWAAVNPILRKGEIGHEEDTGGVKIGDGSAAWNSLPYVVEGMTNAEIDAILTRVMGT